MSTSKYGRGSVRQRHSAACYDKLDEPGPDGETKRLKVVSKGKDKGKHKCRGPWEYHLWLGVDPLTRTRRQATRGGFRTEDDALAALDEERGKDTVTGGRSRGLTLGEWLDRWLSDLDLSPTTVAGYESIVRVHLKPLLGDTLLTELEPEDVSRMLRTAKAPGYCPPGLPNPTKRRGEALSSARVNRIYDVLHTSLEAARRRRLIVWSPASVVDPPRETNAEALVWTPAQAASFLAHPLVARDRLYAAWHCAVYLGLRRGELAGAWWHHLNLDEGWLDLVESRVQVGGSVHTKQPKSRAGIRRIYLDAGTVEVFRAHRQAQREERLRAGARWVPTPHQNPFTGRECDCGGPVLRSPRLLPARVRHRLADGKEPRPQGGPVRPGYLTRRWGQLVEATAADVRVTLHGGRHTSVTTAVQYAAVTEKSALQRYGHSSVQVSRRYQHVDAAAARRDAEAIAAAINQHRVSPGQATARVAGEDQ